MDRDWPKRQAALRAKADEAIREALTAAAPQALPLEAVVTEAMKAITLACWDPALALRDRLSLVNDALILTENLKELAGAAPSARAPLIMEVFQRTNALLRRYARLVRSGNRPA